MSSVEEQPWGPGEPLSLGANSLEVTPEGEDEGSGVWFLSRESQLGVSL